MRALLLLLLLIGAGVGYYVAALAEDPPPWVSKSRAAFEDETEARLEKAADYWLARSQGERAKQDKPRSGAALAVAIRLGRFEALRAGVAPVPDTLRRRFKRHFDQAVLDGARWTVAAPETRLGRVLARWPVKEGAVTLGDVIVFKSKSASRNAGLFAHELAHVEQYRELGVGEFARRYAADPEPLEKQARGKARRVMAAR